MHISKLGNTTFQYGWLSSFFKTCRTFWRQAILCHSRNFLVILHLFSNKSNVFLEFESNILQLQ